MLKDKIKEQETIIEGLQDCKTCLQQNQLELEEQRRATETYTQKSEVRPLLLLDGSFNCSFSLPPGMQDQLTKVSERIGRASHALQSNSSGAAESQGVIELCCQDNQDSYRGKD